MLKTLRNKKVLVCATVAVVALTACVVGCAPKTNPGNATPEATSPTYVPSADKFGVVDASSWADQYPNQYRTYEQNSENNEDGKADYLETNPEIKVLGLGYGYANYYT